MQANERRRQIVQKLKITTAPLSATAIAALFSVSRQVIVGDIALLRAGGYQILATPRGYILEKEGAHDYIEADIACKHDDGQMGEELYTIVDLGGAILNVTVAHSVYGEICAPLHVCSRFDADDFLEKIAASKARPLSELTDGIHLHRIRCADEETLERIKAALAAKGLLLTV